jgi:hypothetical protein
MKKALIGLALATAGFSAHANVLCNIITKSPRYDVASYVRSQTACVTTTHAAGASAGSAAGIGPLIVGLAVYGLIQGQMFKKQIEDEMALEEALFQEAKDTPIDDIIPTPAQSFNIKGDSINRSPFKVEVIINDTPKVYFVVAQSHFEALSKTKGIFPENKNIRPVRNIDIRTITSIIE